MKKINLLFLMLGLVSLTFLSSCGSEDDENPPILTISPSSSQELIEGETFTVNLTAGENPTSKKALKSLVIKLDGATLQTENLSGSTYVDDFEFTVPAARSAAYVYEFTVTDRDDKSTSRTLSITSVEEAPVETPLSAPASFQWQRVGGTTSSSADLALFGLAWSSNSNDFKAIIRKDADKLVILSASDWTNLETVEDLQDLVDNATSVDDYRGVSAAASNTYNDVIATKKGSDYYLINVLTGTVTSGTAGTTITITGNYKN